jgi:hypothetical protein
MTKDEGLKLALEALEGVLDDAPKVFDASISGGTYEVIQCRDAITAIKEALAQPAQEPVAWIVEFENGEQELHWNDTKAALGETQTPLYTTLPQRPWVELTDEDIKKSYEDAYKVAQGRRLEVAFARVINDKLKELNT